MRARAGSRARRTRGVTRSVSSRGLVDTWPVAAMAAAMRTICAIKCPTRACKSWGEAMDYPALAVEPPNIGGNFLAGLGAAQDMQAAQMRNQLLQRQQQMAEARFAEEQAQGARAHEYQNLLA